MNSDGHIAVTKTGDKYVLGWTSYFCGVWKVGDVSGIPEHNYPPTSTGWEQACTQFDRLEAAHAATTQQPRDPYTQAPQDTFQYGQYLRTGSGGMPNSELPNTGYSPATETQTAAVDAYIPVAAPTISGGAEPDRTTAAQWAVPNRVATGQNVSNKPSEGVLAKPALWVWQLSAAAVIIVGVVVGIVGLFPNYLSGISGGQSLVSSGSEMAPHIVYLAAWALAAALILTGKNLIAFASKLALGVSFVTFGLFLSDIASGVNASYIGAGLALAAASWVLCTGGAVMAYFAFGKEKNSESKMHIGNFGVAAILILALAISILYVPAWDSYTYTSLVSGAPVQHVVTAGDAFQLPAPMIAGAVATAVAFFLAALYMTVVRKTKSGHWFFAGAMLVMLSQIISAYIQQANPYTATGISQATAQAQGIVITDGFTPVFYGFFICLIILSVFLASDVASAGYYAGATRGNHVDFLIPQNSAVSDQSSPYQAVQTQGWQNQMPGNSPASGETAQQDPNRSAISERQEP